MSHETHRSLENDGHRVVLRRTDDTVILYARSGRVVTPYWMDLALAGMALRPGTALDGEAVIWREGRLDFGAAQSRAASSVTRHRSGGPGPADALHVYPYAGRYVDSYPDTWPLVTQASPFEGPCRSRTARHSPRACSRSWCCSSSWSRCISRPHRGSE